MNRGDEDMEHSERHTLDEQIVTDFRERMTYGEYLRLDRLLSSQTPLSEHHDEMLFIIIHQTSELWMKLFLHELTSAITRINEDDLATAFKMLSRVSKIQSQIIYAWDVLSTLTPTEYLAFRDKLGQASGFQSFQYREIEFRLGNKNAQLLRIYEKDPALLERLTQVLHAPSIYDAAIGALARAGFSIDRAVLERDVTQPYQANQSVAAAWMAVYQDVQQYWELYELAEKLMDVEDGLQQWRFRHMKTVERIIGFKRGTGGSSGVPYLKGVLEQRIFPELWDVRTQF
jgi:tryptophan 2,3-dioxygenase